MTELEQVAAKIEAGIAGSENKDLSMRELCLKILEQLKITPLKNEPSEQQFFGNPGKEEQIRIEFMQGARELGGALAIRNFDAETEYPGNQFFQNLIRKGLLSIGQEIAADYARKLYPELRHLRDNGEKPPRDRSLFETGKLFYGFTLKNYGTRFELGPVMEMEERWKNSIRFDKKEKCYLEEFTFDSPEGADAMHGAWERFIAKKTARCPVAYRLTVHYDAAECCTILPISHAMFTEKDRKTLNSDGSSSEKRIFHSVFEADRIRTVLQKELEEKEKLEGAGLEQPLKKEIAKPQKPKIGKNPIAEKSQEQPRENLHPQQNSKGRTV